MELRCYQREAFEHVVADWAAGRRATLVEMATGTGKTVLFAALADHVAQRGGRVLILAHRDELIRQAAAKVRKVTGQTPAIEKADEYSDERDEHLAGFQAKANVVVASIQSVDKGDARWRRVRRFDPAEFSLVVADEAHHSTADSWTRVIKHFLDGNPDCKLLGVTATPDRNDDRHLSKLYETCSYRYALPDAIADGYLVPLRQRCVVVNGLDFSKVKTRKGDFVESELEAAMMAERPVQQVVAATIELSYGLPKGSLRDLLAIEDDERRRRTLRDALAGRRHRRTLVFCVGVAHARLTADVLNRWLGLADDVGELADSVDGDMDPDTRRETLRRFAAGERPFLTNCMIATEGFDVPGVEVVVVARPTKSRSLYAQIVGRGTRPLDEIAGRLGAMAAPDERRAAIANSAKPHVEILDFTDNARRHDLVATIDLLAHAADADADPAVVERARELFDEAGEDADPAAVLDRAAEDVANERAAAQAVADAEAEALEVGEDIAAEARRQAWRRGLVAAADYEVDDQRMGGLSAPASRGGATDKQVAMLMGLGVAKATAEGYGRRQASAVIDKLRHERAFEWQRDKLRRAGYAEHEVAGLNVETADREIDRLKAHGRRREAVA